MLFRIFEASALVLSEIFPNNHFVTTEAYIDDGIGVSLTKKDSYVT